MLREELDRVKVTIAVRENDKAFQRILDAGDEGMYRVVTRDTDLRGDTVYLVHSSVDDLKEREKPIFVSTPDPDYEDTTEALFYLVFGRTPAIRTPPVEGIA